MKIKTTSIRRISQTDSLQIILDLRAGRYSLLESLGCHEMREEVEGVGRSFRKILVAAEYMTRHMTGGYRNNLRLAMIKMLNWGAPVRVRGYFPHPRSGVILGYNRPTHGEILRLISLCLSEYSNRKYLFLVDIAMFEVLAPIALRLEMFGLYIAPAITPAAYAEMSRDLDNEGTEVIERIAQDFNKAFFKKCVEFAKSNDVIVFSPSIERQETVFQNYAQYKGRELIETQTTALIAKKLKRSKQLSSYFVPVAVIPPAVNDDKLNLFKTYKIIPCNWLQPEKVRDLCRENGFSSQSLEYTFLKEIADELDDQGAERLIHL